MPTHFAIVYVYLHATMAEVSSWDRNCAGVSNLQPSGCMQPRMAVNVAEHKTVNLLKTL